MSTVTVRKHIIEAQKELDDSLVELQNYVRRMYNLDVKQAKKIIARKIENGLLYPEEITLERLMFQQGFTEKEAEQILKDLQIQELIK